MSKSRSVTENTVVDHVDTQSDTSFTWTPEEEKKLVRKIDLFLMPTIWVMYVFLRSLLLHTLTTEGISCHTWTELISAMPRSLEWLPISIYQATSTA